MRGWVTENQALGALERLRLGQRSGLVCLVYDDDDNFDACVDGYGHIQRNSPSDGQKRGPRWEDVHPF